MAISVPVPKDLSGIKQKVALNLTKRQIICFAAAALSGIPLYLATRKPLGTEVAALLMVMVMLPSFFLAMYQKDGFPAEKIAYFMLRQKVLLPGIRPYKSENLILWLERIEKMYPDGICHVKKGFYTKMVEFFDINYDLLDLDEQVDVLGMYSKFLNYFDPSIKYELFLFNRHAEIQREVGYGHTAYQEKKELAILLFGLLFWKKFLDHWENSTEEMQIIEKNLGRDGSLSENKVREELLDNEQLA